jgi:hypothetical protein
VPHPVDFQALLHNHHHSVLGIVSLQQVTTASTIHNITTGAKFMKGFLQMGDCFLNIEADHHVHNIPQ